MRSLHSLLNEYGESRQNHTNKLIHWMCVPSIFFSIVGLLYSIPLGFDIIPGIPFNAAMAALILVEIYYFKLSPRIALGMLLFSAACLVIAQVMIHAGITLWIACLLIFAVAWIGQFIGHAIEGKKPSFLKDLQFLLIGPAWLMHFIIKH